MREGDRSHEARHTAYSFGRLRPRVIPRGLTIGAVAVHEAPYPNSLRSTGAKGA